MSWLTDYVRPRIRALYTRESKPEVPENLWQACTECERMVFHRDLEQNQRVCPHCSHHMRIGPEQRFACTFDEGAYEDIESPTSLDDPLGFTDQKPYRDRLAAARKATGEKDAMAIAAGKIRGVTAVALVQDFAFMGVSLGVAAGETFLKAS